MLRNFFDTTDGAIAIWSGGLGIFGAVIGGFLGVWLYMRYSYAAQRFFENRLSRPLSRLILNIGAAIFGLVLPKVSNQLRAQAREKADPDPRPARNRNSRSPNGSISPASSCRSGRPSVVGPITSIRNYSVRSRICPGASPLMLTAGRPT